MSTLPYLLALAAVFAGAILVRRDHAQRQAALFRSFETALARAAAGETGVRLEPPGWSAGARQVSAFNLMLERGGYDDDVVAGALDRGACFRRLRETLAFPELAQDGVTFVAIAEIDRFATLRRSIGFRLADGVLRHVSGKIEGALQDCEIGRIGRTSIEFAFAAASVEAAQAALEQAGKVLEERIELDGFTFDLPISIGFADSRKHSLLEELIDQAAAALALAQSKRVAVHFADPSIEVDCSFDDLALMRDLPRAMREDELALHYQPKLRARTDTFESAEALLRWFHPARGQVATDHLIELAENTGAIRDLTEWVIARAVADQRALAAAGHDLTIFVNVSGVLLPDMDFAARLLALVGTSAHRIGLEITETAIIDDPERALANLHAFTAAGLKIAIDDYGSGLSSLAYLKQLPANELKIDRMFISGLVESNRDPLLVRSSIDLAHALEMEVTAEGVEDPLALSLLQVMGCDFIQGYLISPPLPCAALETFLTESASRPAATRTAPLRALIGNQG